MAPWLTISLDKNQLGAVATFAVVLQLTANTEQYSTYEVDMTREAWFAAIKDFIWARSSELSLSQQNIKGV